MNRELQAGLDRWKDALRAAVLRGDLDDPFTPFLASHLGLPGSVEGRHGEDRFLRYLASIFSQWSEIEPPDEPDRSKLIRSIIRAPGRSWPLANELSIAMLSLRDRGRERELGEIVASVVPAIESALPQPGRSSLPIAALWSHLLPFQQPGCRVTCTAETLNWLLNQQHADGFFYPVEGGGACPDLNAANLLLEHIAQLPSAADAARAASERLAMQILARRGSAAFVAESYRSVPLSRRSVWRQPKLVRAWVTADRVAGQSLHEPDGWSTLVRLLTLEKIARPTAPVGRERDHLLLWCSTH